MASPFTPAQSARLAAEVRGKWRNGDLARKCRPLRIAQLRELLGSAGQVAVAAEFEGSMTSDELRSVHDAVAAALSWADQREDAP